MLRRAFLAVPVLCRSGAAFAATIVDERWRRFDFPIPVQSSQRQRRHDHFDTEK